MCERWCRQFLSSSLYLCVNIFLEILVERPIFLSLSMLAFVRHYFSSSSSKTEKTMLRRNATPVKSKAESIGKNRAALIQCSYSSTRISLFIWNYARRCVSQRSVSHIWHRVKCKQTDAEIVRKSELTINRWLFSILICLRLEYNQQRDSHLESSQIYYPRAYRSMKDWCRLLLRACSYEAEGRGKEKSERSKCPEHATMNSCCCCCFSGDFLRCSRRPRVVSSLLLFKSERLTGDSVTRVSNTWSLCLCEGGKKEENEEEKIERSSSIDVLQIHSDSIRRSNYYAFHLARRERDRREKHRRASIDARDQTITTGTATTTRMWKRVHWKKWQHGA